MTVRAEASALSVGYQIMCRGMITFEFKPLNCCQSMIGPVVFKNAWPRAIRNEKSRASWRWRNVMTDINRCTWTSSEGH